MDVSAYRWTMTWGTFRAVSLIAVALKTHGEDAYPYEVGSSVTSKLIFVC